MIFRNGVTAFFFVAAIFSAGCGASAQQREQTNKCLQQCELDSMNCLESVDCTDVSGQLIPCEAQCEQDRIACEEQC